MKRILLTVATMMVALAPVVGQSPIKVDENGLLKKVARSDEDIQNEKKNTKANTWLDRGKAYTDAAAAPTLGLYRGLGEDMLVTMFGKATPTPGQIGTNQYEVYSYDYFDAYVTDGVVHYWTIKKEVLPNAYDTAAEAYVKAAELDPKAVKKANEGIVYIVNEYKQMAENVYGFQQFEQAGNYFRKAYDLQRTPVVGEIDTLSLYNAGFTYTIAKNYKDAIPALKEALEYGYFGDDGNTYYFLFHAYFGDGDLENARQTLMEAVAKYPQNSELVEALLNLYAQMDGDTNEITPIVMRSIENDPQNPELWAGLGRIYDKLDETDKAIDAFAKAVQFGPEDFSNNFNYGYLQVKKADKMIMDLNAMNATSQAEFDAELAKVHQQFKLSIPALERAYELDPNNQSTVELLKNVTFRLRDEDPAMAVKNDKYEAVWKANFE